MLKDEHGVVVADGGLEDALRVVGVRRGHDLEAGNVDEIALGALAVLGAAQRRADGCPHHHRHGQFPAGHVAQFRGLVDELVHALEQEVRVLHIRDRPHPEHGRADRGSRDRLLADRRIDDPFVAELLGEPEVDAERAAESALDPDVLADQEDVVVAAHLLGDRLAQRLGDRQPPGASVAVYQA